ncbi:HesA/MoeB/ThiF family protein [Roseovarius aestuariivivens]|uniref:HesA/MoeB/ThiF family protein n=1 Tax=Roseovarius aestuariivivens TaxID=1888910 RepID=UPI001080A672|nr:HesA/MoeB/ThiF family protein [Roseovarius aestuariivivens]
MTRYARQTILPEMGEAGQQRLRAAHVLVVGAGGLGVPVLQYLTGAGVGAITLVDGDRVEETNLHRQPLYRMSDLGRPKAEAATEAMRALNPDLTLHAVPSWLDPGNAAQLVAQSDLVLDCADTFAASFTLSDACMEQNRPLISASALGLTGYAGGFCGGAPSLRAVFPDLPRSAATCATAGVMGPVVGMIGALQAQMAISTLLGLSPSPLGQFLRFDASSWRSAAFRFDGAPEPAFAPPFIANSDLTSNDLIVDLRAEAPAPFHAQALHIPPENLSDLTPDTNTPRVILACRTGLRAQNAAEALHQRWPGPIGLIAIPDAPKTKDQE